MRLAKESDVIIIGGKNLCKYLTRLAEISLWGASKFITLKAQMSCNLLGLEGVYIGCRRFDVRGQRS